MNVIRQKERLISEGSWESSSETGPNLRSLNRATTSLKQRGTKARRGSDFISIPTNKLYLREEGGSHE